MNLIKSIVIVVIVFLATTFSKIMVAADIPYDINLSSLSTLSYDPFSSEQEIERFSVGLELSDSASTDRSAARARNNGRQLRVRIGAADGKDFVVKNGLQTLPVGVTPIGNSRGFSKSNNEFFRDFRIGNGLRSQNFNFQISVPTSIYADPGLFSLPVRVDLIDILSNTILTTVESEINVQVEVSVQSNLAGGSVNRNPNSRVARVDFGELETGESKQISLQIRGNSSADITIVSENEGRLKMTNDEGVFVNYSVDVDGETSELESPLEIIRAIEKTIRGSAYPIKIQVGDVDGAFAGSYRDIITVEVRPTL